MPAIITPADLEPFADIKPAKAAAMIEDALALAARAAPCIAEEDFAHTGAARAILRGAILRWNDAGSRAKSSEGFTAGPFSHTQSFDTGGPRKHLLWPSEIRDLQKLCETPGRGGAYAVDTAPATTSQHLPWCSGHFGANFCSCGTDIAGKPIFEGATP